MCESVSFISPLSPSPSPWCPLRKLVHCGGTQPQLLETHKLQGAPSGARQEEPNHRAFSLAPPVGVGGVPSPRGPDDVPDCRLSGYPLLLPAETSSNSLSLSDDHIHNTGRRDCKLPRLITFYLERRQAPYPPPPPQNTK